LGFKALGPESKWHSRLVTTGGKEFIEVHLIYVFSKNHKNSYFLKKTQRCFGSNYGEFSLKLVGFCAVCLNNSFKISHLIKILHGFKLILLPVH
jgi:hypothetical protein